MEKVEAVYCDKEWNKDRPKSKRNGGSGLESSGMTWSEYGRRGHLFIRDRPHKASLMDKLARPSACLASLPALPAPSDG